MPDDEKPESKKSKRKKALAKRGTLSSNGYKQGRITDEEAAHIERTLPLSNYADVASQLKRNPDTIRKWAQRNNISKDKISSSKFIAQQIKKDPVFKKLEDYLTDDELIVAHKIYTDMSDQFGADVLYSERSEIVDYAIVSCLLSRELTSEKRTEDEMVEQMKIRSELRDRKYKLESDDTTLEDDDDTWLDKLDDADMRIAELKEDKKTIKTNQHILMSKKEQFLKSLHASREQRAKDLMHSSENFSHHTQYLQKNPDFRKELGLELRKMAIAIDEEFLRLSSIHQYTDKSLDYPIFNSDVVKREYETDEDQR